MIKKNSQFLTLTFAGVFLIITIFAPLFGLAWAPTDPAIVPDCSSTGVDTPTTPMFNCIVLLADNLIDFFLWISIALSAVVFTYAGFLYMTSGGSEQSIGTAHRIFGKVAFGLIVVVGGYMLISLIFERLTTGVSLLT